ncbi:TIM barrel protein [bacterium]|nr:TIM barrel protein [bacterium]
MEDTINRRNAIKAGLLGTAALAAAQPTLAAAKRRIKKTLKIGMINDPKAKTFKEKLQVAKDAGFDGVEPNTLFNSDDVKEIKQAADEVGIALDAIICSTHWRHPLSDPDSAVYGKTMEGMEVSLQNAKDIGADVVLLVPGVVTPHVMYRDAWVNSIARVKELAKTAESMKITIGLENVWNKFLLSPLEYQRYIDLVGSEYVKAFFDIGNFQFWSYPQDWIRTLGDQIVRMDVKDFHNGKRQFTELLQGSVPWKDVMQACDAIGFEGYFAAEVQGGDLNYLKTHVAARMDEIISM